MKPIRPLCSLLLSALLLGACVRTIAPQALSTPPSMTGLTAPNLTPPSLALTNPAPSASQSILAGTPAQAAVLEPTTALATATLTLPPTATQPARPAEVPVTVIPLQGPLSEPKAQISGLAWFDDNLILLPQFPRRMSQKADGSLFAIPRQQILNFLDGKLKGPLTPVEIPFYDGGLIQKIGEGFDGFEAIDFKDGQAFLTIEVLGGASMMGYVVSGRMAPDLSALRLSAAPLAENAPQINLWNRSDESLLVIGNRIFTLYEANGAQVNPKPKAHMFDFSLKPLGEVIFPRMEYRVTDATSLDDHGRFWVINYNFPGDEGLQTSQDPLVEQDGEGSTHAKAATVERLVELQLGHDGITLSGAPPIQLQLLGDEAPRNWEGLARLDGRGFLMATDEHPETILAFVPSYQPGSE